MGEFNHQKGEEMPRKKIVEDPAATGAATVPAAQPATRKAATRRSASAAPARKASAAPRKTRTQKTSPVPPQVTAAGDAVPAAAPDHHESAESILSQAVSRHEQIALLAYSYWQERGCQGGCPEDDWLRAEQEIQNRLLGTDNPF